MIHLIILLILLFLFLHYNSTTRATLQMCVNCSRYVVGDPLPSRVYRESRGKIKLKNKVLGTTIDTHTFNYHFVQLVITASKGIWKN